MNSERRRKKGLQRQPRGNFPLQTYDRKPDTNGAFMSNQSDISSAQKGTVNSDIQTLQTYNKPLETYGTNEEADINQRASIKGNKVSGNVNLESYGQKEKQEKLQTYGNEDPADLGFEIVDEVKPQRLSDSMNSAPDYIPVSDVTEDETSKVGKFLGFFRNRYDQIVENWDQRRQAKSDAYQGFIDQKPEIMAKYKEQLQQKMLDDYSKKLQGDLNGNTDWIKSFTQLSNAGSGIGGMITRIGSKNPSQLIGIKGTVLGPLPQGYVQQPQMQMNPQMQQRQVYDMKMQNRQPVNQMQMQQRYSMPQTPAKLQDPEVLGSQVPKYTAAPSYENSPGAVYARVIKYDRYGKKRSYLRKMRIPGDASGPTMGGQGQNSYARQNVGYQRQNPMLMQQQEDPMMREVGNYQQNIGTFANTGDISGNIGNLSRTYPGSNPDAIYNMVKQRGSQQGFDVNRYTK